MLKLFFKLYGFLIITIVGSLFIQYQIVDYIYRNSEEPIRREKARATFFFLIEENLAPLPYEAWPARFTSLSKNFAHPSYLINLHELEKKPELSTERRQAIESGKAVSIERSEGGSWAYRRLRDSPYVIAQEIPDNNLRWKVDVANLACELSLVGLLVWFWARPFWRDLMNLRKAAEIVGQGDFRVQVEMRKSSPLYHFTLCFNNMTQRVAALLESHRNLTNAVSHELRTPLSRMRFSHALAAEAVDADERERYLAQMERDLNELDDLVGEMLTYAKLERDHPELSFERVAVSAWLRDIIADTEFIAKAHHLDARITAATDIEQVNCEPRYMRRAIGNLLRNAVRHAQSRVKVTVAQHDGQNVVHIDDDGAGVPPDKREHLFEPFTRLDASRNRESGGVGLGLAIVKQIAKWHGGDATVHDSPLGGARFTLRWPILIPAPS